MKNPGTPPGSYAINVIVADTNAGPQHSVALSVTVQ
jgi:hypothetical protein